MEKLVVLFSGLRDSSRVKMAMCGQKASQTDILLAMIVDRLSYLVWFQTEDGHKNRNRPEEYARVVAGIEKERNGGPDVFRTKEELDAALAAFSKQEET